MTPQLRVPVDNETVEALNRRFADVFTTLAADDELFSSDAFFDLNMPVWRMQLQTPGNFVAQIKAIVHGEVRIDVLRTVETVSGFVTEHEEHQAVDGQDLTARRLWLCEVRDGRITEALGYCSGEWDEALRARHAAEAPMLRW
jgi:ketosteroid isomerase-like protein